MLFPKDPASLEGNTTDFMSGAPILCLKELVTIIL